MIRRDTPAAGARGLRPAAKGWCPGAHRAMASGDGLLVRVRPKLARLTLAQALGLCEVAQHLGSGLIDLSNRANLQLRGVTSGRASPMAPGECLSSFAATGATLAVHLSIHRLAEVVAELTPIMGGACPVAVVYRASWPDEKIVRATLATIEAAMGDDVEHLVSRIRNIET